jgi:hypothetical protein
MEHIIKKQIIEIHLTQAGSAFAMQNQMSHYYRNTLLPMLGKIFDELASQDEVIQIDRLQLDLGFISARDLENGKISPEIYQKLYDQIKTFASETKTSQRKNSSTRFHNSAASQWIYYMEHGFLPWNTTQVNSGWYDQVMAIFATDYESVTALRKVMLTNATALTRIIAQHSENFLIRLVEILTSHNQSILKAGLIEMCSIAEAVNEAENGYKFQESKEIYRRIWLHILKLTASDIGKLTTDSLLENMIVSLLKSQATAKFVWEKLSSHMEITLPIFQNVVQESGYKIKTLSVKILKSEKTKSQSILEQEIESKKAQKFLDQKGSNEAKQEFTQDAQRTNDSAEPNVPAVTKDSKKLPTDKGSFVSNGGPSLDLEKTGTPQQIPSRGQAQNLETDLPDLATNLFANPHKQSVKHAEDIIDEDGIFVQQAGIVLLHPFLSQFFKRISVVNNGQFIDAISHRKALYLMHYMATGQTDAEEYELLIPKILSAYPLDDTVEKDIEITDEEFTEANELLLSAISQWEILKNTSPDGLREGFLQRNGKLYTNNGKLHLQVEVNSIDVILDYLPWNLSIIKLPWMKEVLRVEWR